MTNGKQEVVRFFPVCPSTVQRGWRREPIGASFTCPVTRAGSDGRCNTIWYKAVFKGGVYEGGETVWAFGGAASDELLNAVVRGVRCGKS